MNHTKFQLNQKFKSIWIWICSKMFMEAEQIMENTILANSTEMIMVTAMTVMTMAMLMEMLIVEIKTEIKMETKIGEIKTVT